MKKILFGEVKKSGMPAIQVIVETDGVKDVTGELRLFRGYSFQVTDSDGFGDLGCSKVIGFANIKYEKVNTGNSWSASNLSEKGAMKELLKGQALLAIVDHLRYILADVSFSSLYSELKDSKSFDEFLNITYQMIKDNQ